MSNSFGGTKRRRGNPNWTNPVNMQVAAAQPTRFELEVARLGLNDIDVPRSRALREWARANYKRAYVPEELLLFWGLTFHPDEIEFTEPPRAMEVSA